GASRRAPRYRRRGRSATDRPARSRRASRSSARARSPRGRPAACRLRSLFRPWPSERADPIVVARRVLVASSAAMPPSSASVRPNAHQGLGPGAVVGGRFAIERAVGEDALGTILAARDQKTNRPVAVRVLAPGLIATPAALE